MGWGVGGRSGGRGCGVVGGRRGWCERWRVVRDRCGPDLVGGGFRPLGMCCGARVRVYVACPGEKRVAKGVLRDGRWQERRDAGRDMGWSRGRY